MIELNDELTKNYNGNTRTLNDVLPATFEYTNISGETIPVELGFEHIHDEGRLDWTQLDIPDIATYIAMRSHTGLAYQVELFNREWEQELQEFKRNNMLERARENGIPEHSIEDEWYRNIVFKQWKYQVLGKFYLFGDIRGTASFILQDLIYRNMEEIHHPGDPFVFWTYEELSNRLWRYNKETLENAITDLSDHGWLIEYDDDYYDLNLPDSNNFDYLKDCDVRYIFNLRKYHRLLDIERTGDELVLSNAYVPLEALRQLAISPQHDEQAEWEYALDMDNWGYYTPHILDVEKVRSLDTLDNWNDVVIAEEDWEKNILKINHGHTRTLNDVFPLRVNIYAPTGECRPAGKYKEDTREISFSFEQIDEHGELDISLLDEDDTVIFFAYREGDGALDKVAEFNRIWRKDMQAYIRAKQSD